MTGLVSHQHNGAPVTTAHDSEHQAEVEAWRVSAGLPIGAPVVLWESDAEEGL